MVKILTGEWWSVCKENFNPFVLVSAGRPPFDELPYIVTPEGKILGQSGPICKYICKKGGDVSRRVVHQGPVARSMVSINQRLIP